MVTRAASGPNERWDGNELGKLRRGETEPTLPLIRAISTAFSVTNPVFIARSRDEAVDMRGVQLKHEQLRAQAMQQQAIEGKEVTGRMAAHLADSLGADAVEELRARTEANRSKRVRRAARGQRDRLKK